MTLIKAIAEYSRMIELGEKNESGVAYLGWFVHLWYGYDVRDVIFSRNGSLIN